MLHRLVFAAGLAAPALSMRQQEARANATNGMSLLAVRAESRLSKARGKVPETDFPESVMDDYVAGNMKFRGENASLSTLEEAGHASTKQDRCSAFMNRDVDGFGIAGDILTIAEGGTAIGEAAKTMRDLAKFSHKLGAASGALGIAGGGVGIVGELFFDDPTDSRIDSVETAVECLEDKVNQLAEAMVKLTERVEKIEDRLDAGELSRTKIQMDFANQEMKDFMGLTAKKFTKHACLRSSVNSDGHLFSDCNAHSLWNEVVNFRDSGTHQWTQFRNKSWQVIDAVMKLEWNTTMQKIYISPIIQQATAGMQTALLVYNIVNARAVSICKWRYKYYENKDSIPAEYNSLCADDPSRSAANMASRALKEIVVVARESLVEMAMEARAFIDKYLDYCVDHQVWPIIDITKGVAPRHCSKSTYDEHRYYAQIPAPSYPEKVQRGCCKMRAPYNDFGPWYNEHELGSSKLPFGIPSESYMWANLVQPVEASLQPPLPATPLTLNPVDMTKPGQCITDQVLIRFPWFNGATDWPLLRSENPVPWVAKEFWGSVFGSSIDRVVCARICRRFGESVCGQIKYHAGIRSCWLLAPGGEPCSEAEASPDVQGGWEYRAVY